MAVEILLARIGCAKGAAFVPDRLPFRFNPIEGVRFAAFVHETGVDKLNWIRRILSAVKEATPKMIQSIS